MANAGDGYRRMYLVPVAGGVAGDMGTAIGDIVAMLNAIHAGRAPDGWREEREDQLADLELKGKYNEHICQDELSQDEREWLIQLVKNIFTPDTLNARIDVSALSDFELCDFVRLNMANIRHYPQMSCMGDDPIMGSVTGETLDELPFYHEIMLRYPRDSGESDQCYTRYNLINYLNETEGKLPNGKQLSHKSQYALESSPYRQFEVVSIRQNNDGSEIYDLKPIKREKFLM